MDAGKALSAVEMRQRRVCVALQASLDQSSQPLDGRILKQMEEIEDGITVHFPFRWLHPPEPYDLEFSYQDGRPERIRSVSDERGEAYVEISRLPNWPVAEQMVYRCWFGLLCYSAMRHKPHEVHAAIAEVDWIDQVRRPFLSQMFKDDLEGVDGIVVGRVPYVHRDRHVVRRKRLTLSIPRKATSGEGVAKELVDSCLHHRFYDLADDPKLIGALEMANLAFGESPKVAGFVLIVSALEALMPEGQISDAAMGQIGLWEAEAVKLGLTELTDLRALKHPDVGKRFRTLAKQFPPPDVTNAKTRGTYNNQIVKAYDCRSKLVHQGSCDEDALTLAYPIAYSLLQRVLAHRLGWTDEIEVATSN